MARVLIVEDNEPNRDMLSRRLEEASGGRTIPVIALTAHALTGDEARARAAGCDGFDTEPIEIERLIAKIERRPTRPPP